MIRNIIHTWLMTVWILCGICHTASAEPYDLSSQSASLGYQPASTAPYDLSSQSASWDYQPASTATVPSSARVMDEYECPAFNFQSTSPYLAPLGDASSGITTQRAPRRSTGFNWEDDPEDNPIGVLPNQAPVGEPLVLLVLALLYIVLRKKPTPDPSLKGRESEGGAHMDERKLLSTSKGCLTIAKKLKRQRNMKFCYALTMHMRLLKKW